MADPVRSIGNTLLQVKLNQKTELLEMIQVIRDSLTKGWSLSRALGLKHGMGMGMGMGMG
eukprot:CAMPEP_0194080484 /NCGR_PEP_ID=MMETSP0149-20130528/6501_1 /TAXON_ID=122233 /ORGANISM="Chaetoceros debilis, Strain MM31A-1" /LENGTH=59 /DNA_ID=CAMNT_0038762211 /DNA_START=51 /DNA_END=226 /DNA_ORIENTATION=+